MTAAGMGQIVLYAVVLVGLGVPLGAYMARVYTGKAMVAQRILGPFERWLYRIFGIEPDQEQHRSSAARSATRSASSIRAASSATRSCSSSRSAAPSPRSCSSTC